MEKNLTWKIIFIVALVVVAILTLHPADKTLKPGLDLAGGTSLIYEIDAHGLDSAEKKDLSTRMITILRRRIDPANIQNLVWRPQGNTRFEIQMPLANKEARQKRQSYEAALSDLLDENINPAVIMRSLQKPADDREKDFEKFAQNSAERHRILTDLATAYDQRRELRKKRDDLATQLKTPESLMEMAGLDKEQIRSNLSKWIKLDEYQLKQALIEYLGSEGNLDLLTRYVGIFAKWADVTEQLTDPEEGKNIRYKTARKNIDKLNLSQDQIDAVLAMSPKSGQREDTVEQLKTEFSDRLEKISTLVAAFDDYYPFRGRLDDPKDLQRMLKGAGILEFRILPTIGHPQVDADEMNTYAETLREKGPRYASDHKFIWCEIENIEDWRVEGAVVAPFGDKYYVLASNKLDEKMVHGSEQKQWKLKKAAPSFDNMGRRAIGFSLDERAGSIFGKITGQNKERPLCILLDGQAISAPNIESRITTRGVITGDYSQTEQDDMVNKLNAGSLPARLIEQPISTKSIGPSIGAVNRDQGIKAAIIGFVAVVICMAIYYTLAGSVADIALFMNMLFVLAIMALVKATFTLPGIAGIILTIGMSVDANVLIFERIREEQQRGSSLRIAIKNGYQRALRTILDANITTFITAAILFWVAPEEIKGFAIVLMLGILSSMFTALFVTRVAFDYLLAKRIIKEHLLMLRLIHKPNINWMKARPVFLTISTFLIVAGMLVFFTRDDVKNNKYDIEFTGGTSATITLKDGVNFTRQDVEDRIREAGRRRNNPALAAANVYSVGKSGKQYEINTTETNKITTLVTFPQAPRKTIADLAADIKKAQGKFEGKLNNLIVSPEDDEAVFKVATSQANKSLVKTVLSTAFPNAQISESQVEEIVNEVILDAFAEDLEIQLDLKPQIASQEKIDEQLIESFPELTDFLGGLKITCRLQKPVTLDEIENRFKELRFKPDMRNTRWYAYEILGTDLTKGEPAQLIDTFVYLSVEPEAGFREFSDDEWTSFIENETSKVLAATQLESSLSRVTQISPSIGSEAKNQAILAIVLSLFAIVAYIWIRFGDVRYGVAAIVALVHDVAITLGAITACTYIASTPLGEYLLIGDFKINQVIIAAFLTLIGYSLNDTIVVFDRIRENRHKDQLTPEVVTNSINQTISRTLLTSLTTFIVVLIMYIFGGQALRGFTFAIGLGIIIGTYSSIAIAAPILLIGLKTKTKTKKK